MKTVFYTIADNRADDKYNMLAKTFKHFNPTYELLRFTDKDVQEAKDPHIFMRATPYFTRKLLKEGYDLVIKLDSDQLVLGDLDYVVDIMKSYDVGTVHNLNRIDPSMYPLVQGWGITPQEYYNIGLVAITSLEFVNEWHELCNSQYFPRMQYGDQDFFNLLTHYGRHRVKCFDVYDHDKQYYAWHGLKAKGEGQKMVVRDGKVILPRGEDHYPERDTEIKLYHWAGGFNEPKMNYKQHMSEEVSSYIDNILYGQAK